MPGIIDDHYCKLHPEILLATLRDGQYLQKQDKRETCAISFRWPKNSSKKPLGERRCDRIDIMRQSLKIIGNKARKTWYSVWK